MGLNRRSIRDPRLTTAVARVAQGDMTSSVLIRRARGAAGGSYFDDTPDAEPYFQLWTGMARFEQLADNAARALLASSETSTVQSLRFQVPIAEGIWNSDVSFQNRRFIDQDEIIITGTFFPGAERMKEFVYVIRNPLVSANPVVQNFVVDVNLKRKADSGNSR